MFEVEPERGQIKVPLHGSLNQLADSGWHNRTCKNLCMYFWRNGRIAILKQVGLEKQTLQKKKKKNSIAANPRTDPIGSPNVSLMLISLQWKFYLTWVYF